MDDAREFYLHNYKRKYNKKSSYNYAICLKKENYPIGYINVETNENFDLGYGLRSEFQHRGIVTEAGKAVIKQLKKDGIPFVTATHDVNNPKSGEVMKRLGMMYQYSYKEQWQPKGFPVIFRMYQLNLDENKNRVYKKYWNDSMVHFVEENV